jgi:hypothetical protein
MVRRERKKERRKEGKGVPFLPRIECTRGGERELEKKEERKNRVVLRTYF